MNSLNQFLESSQPLHAGEKNTAPLPCDLNQRGNDE